MESEAIEQASKGKSNSRELTVHNQPTIPKTF
jgi:hypothetical protein